MQSYYLGDTGHLLQGKCLFIQYSDVNMEGFSLVCAAYSVGNFLPASSHGQILLIKLRAPPPGSPPLPRPGPLRGSLCWPRLPSLMATLPSLSTSFSPTKQRAPWRQARPVFVSDIPVAGRPRTPLAWVSERQEQQPQTAELHVSARGG